MNTKLNNSTIRLTCTTWWETQVKKHIQGFLKLQLVTFVPIHASQLILLLSVNKVILRRLLNKHATWPCNVTR